MGGERVRIEKKMEGDGREPSPFPFLCKQMTSPTHLLAFAHNLAESSLIVVDYGWTTPQAMTTLSNLHALFSLALSITLSTTTAATQPNHCLFNSLSLVLDTEK